MSKILIFGVGGMAGHMIYNVLKEDTKHIVFGTKRNQKNTEEFFFSIDINDKTGVALIVNKIRPDYVINCIGVLVSRSKNFPAEAIYSNAYFPHFLKEVCEINNSHLIHISTDCVFSGNSGKYIESSLHDAKDFYGKSKSLGEIVSENHTTIRTSIIGPELNLEGSGLFSWFMRQKGSVDGYVDAIWSGVTTFELAKFVKYIINSSVNIPLVHLTNNLSVSKFELLMKIAEIFSKEVNVTPITHTKIDKSFISTNTKLQYIVPSYSSMIIELKEFMVQHKDIYDCYLK